MDERQAVRRANDAQVGGDHYKKHGVIQPWDAIRIFKLGFFEGVVFKYLVRWKDKGGVEDLKKARHYLDKLIEDTEAETAAVVKKIEDSIPSSRCLAHHLAKPCGLCSAQPKAQ